MNRELRLNIKKGSKADNVFIAGKEATVLYPADLKHCGKWLFERRVFDEEKSCINVKIDDLICNKDLGESIEIEVEYFDSGRGSFTVLYDGIDDSEKQTEVVDLYDSKKWRTYKFYIQNLRSDDLCGYDFRISLYSEFMGNSFEPVPIGKITAKRTGKCSAVKILPAVSDFTGNNFFIGDEVKLDVVMKNRTDNELTLSAKYTLVDRDTFTPVWFANDSISLSANEEITASVMPKTEIFGVYLLIVELYNDEVYSVKSTKLAKINSSQSVPANKTLGFSDHFAKGIRNAPDVALELMRKGGFGINRDEILWKDFELEKDSFNIPEFTEEYLKAAEKYGIEPCFTLGKNNPAIGVENTPARDEYEQERWRLYVRNVVTMLKGRVKLYSIYNESNIPLKKTESVHWYVEDLRIAYEEIKAIDPDALVLGFTSANIPYYWFEEAFKQGALNYCDVVDIHPYCWNTTPEEFDFVERVGRVYGLIKKYGGNQPVWNTEFGYPVMPKGCGIENELLQGENLMRTYMYCRANNILDKFYIYQFADNGRERRDCEPNFGVIYGVNPKQRQTMYAAKPAFLMLANMNNLTAEAECLGEFFCHDRMTMVRFEKPDKTGVFAFWAYWNTTYNIITMDLGVNEIYVYDRYGNRKCMQSDNGIYELYVDYKTTFVEGKFTKFIDLSEYPA